MLLEEEDIIKITERNDLPIEIKRIVRLKNLNDYHYNYKNPKLFGAYIILTKYGEHYVGSTENFHERIRAHIGTTVKCRIPTIAYLYETYNIEDARELENWLIYWTNPSLNVIGKSDDNELNEVEKELLKKPTKIGEMRRKGLYDLL